MSTGTANQLAERELTIVVSPDEFADYIGTAAQLQAEGLIAGGFEWPHSDKCKYWKANGFMFAVGRIRPAGHKGPWKTWIELDHWLIRITVADRDFMWHKRRAVERAAEKLRHETHLGSDAGRMEWQAKRERYWVAREDQAFQAFKAIFVPERKKPGSKAKAEAAQGAQQ